MPLSAGVHRSEPLPLIAADGSDPAVVLEVSGCAC